MLASSPYMVGVSGANLATVVLIKKSAEMDMIV